MGKRSIRKGVPGSESCKQCVRPLERAAFFVLKVTWKADVYL